MNTSEVTTALETKLGLLKTQLRMTENCLSSHNFIVQIGAYTATSNNETNILEITLKTLPSQWSIEGAKDIQKRADFTNNKGKVTPVIYGVSDWYIKEIEMVELTLDTLSKMN